MKRIKLIKNPKGFSVYQNETQLSAILYDTEIVRTTNNNKTIELSNGGWVTASTAKCINLVLSHLGLKYRVFRKKGYMFLGSIQDKDLILPFTFNRLTLNL